MPIGPVESNKEPEFQRTVLFGPLKASQDFPDRAKVLEIIKKTTSLAFEKLKDSHSSFKAEITGKNSRWVDANVCPGLMKDTAAPSLTFGGYCDVPYPPQAILSVLRHTENQLITNRNMEKCTVLLTDEENSLSVQQFKGAYMFSGRNFLGGGSVYEDNNCIYLATRSIDAAVETEMFSKEKIVAMGIKEDHGLFSSKYTRGFYHSIGYVLEPLDEKNTRVYAFNEVTLGTSVPEWLLKSSLSAHVKNLRFLTKLIEKAEAISNGNFFELPDYVVQLTGWKNDSNWCNAGTEVGCSIEFLKNNYTVTRATLSFSARPETTSTEIARFLADPQNRTIWDVSVKSILYNMVPEGQFVNCNAVLHHKCLTYAERGSVELVTLDERSEDSSVVVFQGVEDHFAREFWLEHTKGLEKIELTKNRITILEISSSNESVKLTGYYSANLGSDIPKDIQYRLGNFSYASLTRIAEHFKK